MNEFIPYIKNLQNKAYEHLQKEYDLSSFRTSDFVMVNFYIIDQCLSNNISLFIKTIEKEQAALTYVPTLLSVSISLFFKNFCDDSTTYEIGETLQKKGIRFEIIGKTQDGFQLRTNHKGGYTKLVTNKQIKGYIVTNSDLSKRKVRIRFDDYQKLFKEIFNVNYFPSKFRYKAAILIEKKDFIHELKHQVYTDIDLLKAIPIQWITKTGKFENPHIPIDPMIYFVPDYETLSEYVMPMDSSIETVVMIGKNKYKEENLNKLKRDLYNEIVPHALLIGSEEIEDSGNQFLHWKWTYPEVAYLTGCELPKINTQKIVDKNFVESISQFYEFISDTEKKYAVQLSFLRKFKKFLYSLVIPPNTNSRMLNHKEYVMHLMVKESCELIEQELFNQNVSAHPRTEHAKELIANIFDSFSNPKSAYVESEFYDIILVPEQHYAIWSDELTSKKNGNVLTFREFSAKHSDYQTVKSVLVLSLFGYTSPYQLIERLNSTDHTFTFLLFPEEDNLLQNLLNKYHNTLIEEYNSENRKKLSGVLFQLKPKPVEISDLIEELSQRIQKDSSVYDYEVAEQVNYLLKFVDSEDIFILDGSRAVLLENDSGCRKQQVRFLRPQDKVRIYLNVSKEKLYEIAEAEDTGERFLRIDQHSKLWKQCLRNYFESKVKSDPTYDENSLLSELQGKGLPIKNEHTIKKWLNLEDKEKFPNARASLIVIKALLDDAELNQHFEAIMQSRRLYRSIMISLGHNLSDDVMDYIISNHRHKGKVLEKFSDEEIAAFIDKAAPLRTIKTINITEEDESN